MGTLQATGTCHLGVECHIAHMDDWWDAVESHVGDTAEYGRPRRCVQLRSEVYPLHRCRHQLPLHLTGPGAGCRCGAAAGKGIEEQSACPPIALGLLQRVHRLLARLVPCLGGSGARAGNLGRHSSSGPLGVGSASTTGCAICGAHRGRSIGSCDAACGAGHECTTLTDTAINVQDAHRRARSAYADGSASHPPPGRGSHGRLRGPPCCPLCVGEAASSPTQRSSPTAPNRRRRAEEEGGTREELVSRGDGGEAFQEHVGCLPNAGEEHGDKDASKNHQMEVGLDAGRLRWRCGHDGRLNLCDNANGVPSMAARRMQIPWRSWRYGIRVRGSLCGNVYSVGGICTSGEGGHGRGGCCGSRCRCTLCVNAHLAMRAPGRRGCWRCGSFFGSRLRDNVHIRLRCRGWTFRLWPIIGRTSTCPLASAVGGCIGGAGRSRGGELGEDEGRRRE